MTIVEMPAPTAASVKATSTASSSTKIAGGQQAVNARQHDHREEVVQAQDREGGDREEPEQGYVDEVFDGSGSACSAMVSPGRAFEG